MEGNSGQSADMVTSPEGTQTTDMDREVAKEKQQLPSKQNRVIYTADLHLEVKDINKSNRLIEEKIKKYNGYIVESNIYRQGDQNHRASLTLRIPQKDFNVFLTEVEEHAVKVHQRSVNGSDVSEEYVDLESRLNAKKVVEKRLLEFMQKAETTEDLLKISSDLAAVQEQIEQISGRIKFLDDQIEFSTVTLTLVENKVNLPDLEKNDLNTWEKTKKQFLTSINYILLASSGAIIFIIGNLPILLLVSLVVAVIVLIIKRKKKPD